MNAAAREAERLLLEAGLQARVTAAGHDGSVAAIALSPERWDALLEGGERDLVARIKALGFRYVALDLDPPDAGG